MKKLALIAALGASCLAIAACSRDDSAAANESLDNVSAGESMGSVEGAEMNGTGAAGNSAFPKGARIVEEKGVTYRVNADGSRVALSATDSKIVSEGGKRYRVDPDGTRVRIDNDGLGIDIDAPDVDLGINSKGNPDLDVKTKGDNNAGPD
jgi:hypothetical protein